MSRGAAARLARGAANATGMKAIDAKLGKVLDGSASVELELMHQEFRVKKEEFKGDQQQSILEKYGGEEHLDAPPKELLLAQTVGWYGVWVCSFLETLGTCHSRC